MSQRPWHKRYHSDALTGYRGLSLEERGAYTTILDLLYDSGDDALCVNERWMTGQLNCSTRKWRALRASLIEAGKIEELPDGRITNARYLREIAKMKELSSKRAEAGKAGGINKSLAHTKGLDSPMFGPNIASSGQDDNHIEVEEGPENSQSGLAIAKAKTPLRARVPDTRDQSLNLTHPSIPDSVVLDGSGSDGQELSRLDDGDLMEWYHAIAVASGHNPAMPGQIDRAMGFVERWRADGISLEDIILPAIKATISETRDPTRTLGRFDARIRHEHARLAATPEGRKYQPPPSPVLAPDGEDEQFRPLRSELLDRLGPQAYSTFCNSVRFEAVDQANGDQHILRVIDKRPPAMALLDAERIAIVKTAARHIGFVDVW